MPLKKSSSKQAFEHNLKAEMHAGKPQDQSLAIAYDVQRRSKKKKKMAEGGDADDAMTQGQQQSASTQSGGIAAQQGYAEGGEADKSSDYSEFEVHDPRKLRTGTIRTIREGQHAGRTGVKFPGSKEEIWNSASDVHSNYKVRPKSKMASGGEISASDEKRPMPDETDHDEMDVRQNSGKKPLKDSGWTDTPTETQAKANDIRGRTQKIKHPKMVKSDILQVRLRDEEDDLQNSAAPASPDEQPSSSMDEEDAKKRGEGPEKQRSISTGRQVMAKGGKVESSDYDDSDPNAATDSDMHLTPSEDEAEEMARHHEEEYQRQTSGDPDYSKPHSDDIDTYMYAEGGDAEGGEYDTPEQGVEKEESAQKDLAEQQGIATARARGGYISLDDEMEDEEHDSIAAAVMARMERAKAQIASGNRDMDIAARFARGGEITEERGHILSEGAMDSDDSDQAGLSRNAEEDQNHEDQASFHALEKENYSESDGLDDLDYDTSRSEGDSEEDETSDPHDMVDSIRRKMRQKRSFSDN